MTGVLSRGRIYGRRVAAEWRCSDGAGAPAQKSAESRGTCGRKDTTACRNAAPPS